MSTGALAAGVLIGAGTIYAYKNNYQISDVLNIIDLNTEKFEIFIENLIAYGREFLIKLYNIIKTFVMEIMFKLKIIESRTV